MFKFQVKSTMSQSSLLDARKTARAAKHQQDEDLRALHERALALVSDGMRAPSVMARPQAAIAKWESAQTCSPFYVEEWRRILADPVEGLRRYVLQADAPNGVALMHNTPFGFLLREPAAA
jgi:broad specificity phosphatase PhoE